MFTRLLYQIPLNQKLFSFHATCLHTRIFKCRLHTRLTEFELNSRVIFTHVWLISNWTSMNVKAGIVVCRMFLSVFFLYLTWLVVVYFLIFPLFFFYWCCYNFVYSLIIETIPLFLFFAAFVYDFKKTISFFVINISRYLCCVS